MESGYDAVKEKREGTQYRIADIYFNRQFFSCLLRLLSEVVLWTECIPLKPIC